MTLGRERHLRPTQHPQFFQGANVGGAQFVKGDRPSREYPLSLRKTTIIKTSFMCWSKFQRDNRPRQALVFEQVQTNLEKNF